MSKGGTGRLTKFDRSISIRAPEPDEDPSPVSSPRVANYVYQGEEVRIANASVQRCLTLKSFAKKSEHVDGKEGYVCVEIKLCWCDNLNST